LSGQQPSLTGQEFTSQSYGQNSDSLFSEDAISQKVIGQSVPDSTISQFEMPPQRPLPMPPKHDSKQQVVEEKFVYCFFMFHFKLV
jgi:hypothetical protein